MYAMKVDEILHFDEYFRDSRFKQKKPVRNGRWPKPVGDNMYYLDEDEYWKQHPTNFHTDMVETDTENPYVFIATEFYYFGENRLVQQLPEPASQLEQYWLDRKVARGMKYFRDSEYGSAVGSFIKWLRKYGKQLTTREPIDRVDAAVRGCASAP